jgi:hypothetical protein
MRLVVPWVVSLIPCLAVAETYRLLPERYCTIHSDRPEVSCKARAAFSGANLTIFEQGPGWYGRERIKTLAGENENTFPLEVIQKDENTIAFRYPVLWSGLATIVVMKKERRYFFSEISYSETLESSASAVEQGRIVVEP